jgi:hypothetical protein
MMHAHSENILSELFRRFLWLLCALVNLSDGFLRICTALYNFETKKSDARALILALLLLLSTMLTLDTPLVYYERTFVYSVETPLIKKNERLPK